MLTWLISQADMVEDAWHVGVENGIIGMIAIGLLLFLGSIAWYGIKRALGKDGLVEGWRTDARKNAEKQTEVLTKISATMQEQAATQSAQQISCSKHADLVTQLDSSLHRTAKATEKLVELQTAKHRDIEDIGNRVKGIEAAIKKQNS